MSKPVTAVREVGGTKYHAGVIDYFSKQPVATICNLSKFTTKNNEGVRRQFYLAGSYVNCKRCLAALAKQERENA